MDRDLFTTSACLSMLLEYMALNKRGVNCLWKIFENFDGIMKVNEESHRKKLRKAMHKAALVGIQKINRLFLWFNWLFLSAVNKNNLKQIYVRLGKEKIKKTDIYCFTLTPRAKCNPQKPLVIHYAIKTRFQTPHTKVVTLNPSRNTLPLANHTKNVDLEHLKNTQHSLATPITEIQ